MNHVHDTPDNCRYYDFWRDTCVATALSSGIAVGGSSAGLAIQGEFVFDAQHGSVRIAHHTHARP